MLTRPAPRHLVAAAVLAVVAGGVSMAVTANGSGASSTLPALTGAGETRTGPGSTEHGSPAVSAASDSGNRLVPLTADVPVSVDTADYHHATLADAATAFAGATGNDAVDTGNTLLTHGSARAALTPTDACLLGVGRQLTATPPRTWTVVAVRLARFDGRPATLLALTAPAPASAASDASASVSIAAVAVDGRCDSAQPVLLDDVTGTAPADS